MDSRPTLHHNSELASPGVLLLVVVAVLWLLARAIARVVARDGPAGPLLLGLVIPRQVLANGRPVRSAIGRAK